MRALVTGANGLVGANLVRALVREGHEVRPLVRAGADLTSLEGVPVEPVVGDVLDADRLRRIVGDCEVVFHTAVPFVYGTVDVDLERVAVTGTANVLRAASDGGVRRVVVTSSSVVFGFRPAPQAIDESVGVTDPARQPSYVAAKIQQDRRALALASELGVELVLVCPTMSVGPYATRLGPSNAVLIQVLVDPLGVTYDGGCNIVAVEDVAYGHLLAAERGGNGEHYLLGAENLRWADVHDTVADLAGAVPRRLELNHTLTYLAASVEELRARVGRRAPVATREQASMVGRFYWYRHDRAAALGYAPRPARRALAEALAWLAGSPHVSRETRARLRLHPEVYEARRSLTARERELRSA